MQFDRSYQVEEGCAFFFDADGTLRRRQLALDVVKRLAKTRPAARRALDQVEPALRAYEKRAGRFHDAQMLIIKHVFGQELFAGMPVAEMAEACRYVVETHGDFVQFFTRALARAAQLHNIPRVLISGSFTEVVEPFGKTLDIHICLGTEMEIVDGVYTGRIAKEPVTDKGLAVGEVAVKHGFNLAVSGGVGDTRGDKSMLDRFAYPVVINPKDADIKEFARRSRALVIYEKGEAYSVFRANECGRFEEAELSDGLPEPLASTLKQLLLPYFG